MIDVSEEINTVSRSVGRRTLEAGEARTMRIARVYDTTLEDLWDACTNAERIPRWFLPVTGELRVGGRYQLQGNAGGTIERCDPPRSFFATWEYAGEVSWIEVRLTSEDEQRTRFELEHVAHVDDERWAQFGPGAVGLGWEQGLMGLGLHLRNGGARVDPKEVEAWATSAEGRDFFTRSGNAWCEAAVAAGDDPTAARAAADRTIGFYTGAAAG